MGTLFRQIERIFKAALSLADSVNIHGKNVPTYTEAYQRLLDSVHIYRKMEKPDAPSTRVS